MPNCMKCSDCQWIEGHRSYGADIPASCQGAYFPGDEPYHECSLDSGIQCAEDLPVSHCPRYEQSKHYCPACAVDGERTTLLYCNHYDIFECPVCGMELNGEAELIQELFDSLIQVIEHGKSHRGISTTPHPPSCDQGTVSANRLKDLGRETAQNMAAGHR